MTTPKTLQAVLLCIGLFIGGAVDGDECRDLSRQKRVHVFVIADSHGPFYGYAELTDVKTAWKTSGKNWTETVQAESVTKVRQKLAKMMQDEVIPNPNPPKIIPSELFGPYFEWGDDWRKKKDIYNVADWAPPRRKPYGMRSWTLSASRD